MTHTAALRAVDSSDADNGVPRAAPKAARYCSISALPGARTSDVLPVERHVAADWPATTASEANERLSQS